MKKRDRKRICSSNLVEELQALARIAYRKRTAGGHALDLELAIPFLQKKGLDDHIKGYAKRSRKGHRSRRAELNSEQTIYRTNDIVIRDMEITMSDALTGGNLSQWEHLWFVSWHFENCTFRSPSPNMAHFNFPWRGNFRFYRNEFDFGEGWGMRAWTFVFEAGSTVTLQGNDFHYSSVQVQCKYAGDDAGIEKLSWNGREALLVKDDDYFLAMIRKNYRLPDSVRIETEHSSYYRGLGLYDVAFVGNRGIDRLEFYCSAEYYTLRGGNRIESLDFNEFHSAGYEKRHHCRIYLGLREKIDPFFRQPLRHRRVFVSLRGLAAANEDPRLTRVLDKQLERIEYFLARDQELSSRSSAVEWSGYAQDRIFHAWRRWSADFHRSWFRPLAMIVAGYAASNAIAGFWIEDFTSDDWITFSLRPINKIPFYVDYIKEIFGGRYESLENGEKNWLRLIGLLQVVWIALWSFSFRKTISR